MTDISVVIPTYNRSTLVVEAVDSVLAQQSDARLETIVIDDGSTDDTRQSLEKYAGRITYRRQRNAGMNAARNAGVREARGRYVAFLDSDDAWLPCKSALQLAVMERLEGAGIEEHASRRYSSTELGIPSPEPFAVYVCDIYRLSLYQPVVHGTLFKLAAAR